MAKSVSKTKVFLARLSADASPGEMAQASERLWSSSGAKSIIPKGGLTAIKQHFGEKGGTNFIPPEVAKKIGLKIREAGGKPFITDSNTLYNGNRSNAVDHLELAHTHGFSHEALGFPVIIADGLKGESQVTLKVKKGLLKNVFIAGAGYMADSSVVLTHVTGHLLAGLGASIKNVAMGFGGRAGKLQQHHCSAPPSISAAQCTACGRCAIHCPAAAITIKKAAEINAAKCIGCGECYAYCPTGAVSFEWSSTSDDLQKRMVEYCLAFHEEKKGRVIYYNFITRVTKDCDCLGKGDRGLPDYGVIASYDPVAVDAAAMDLLIRQHGRDVIKEFWPNYNPWVQIDYAVEQGLGRRDYELIEI